MDGSLEKCFYERELVSERGGVGSRDIFVFLKERY